MDMTKAEILGMVDHTLLSQTATEEDIKALCDDGIEYNCASVCIPNTHIRFAADYVKGRIKVCAVIGFPLGYMVTDIKCLEAAHAVADGASEIDMVANLCHIRSGNFDAVRDDIAAVRRAVGDHTLKVIVETCLLTDNEKKRMCGIVAEAGADYIKTSTGFSTGGATKADVALLAANVPAGLKIKAAGGIRSFEDAEDFIRLGASRLGTSSLVKIIKKEKLRSY